MSQSQPASRSSHLSAVLQALFVTFLWSTSWVLIKHGLEELPALTFAGMRYVLAALLLWAFLLASPRQRAALRGLKAAALGRLLALGLVMYTLTQGAQFVALAHLPAQSVTLMLSLTPVLVALGSAAALSERLSLRQWSGVALVAVGAAVYFLPITGLTATVAGWSAALIGLVANAGAAVLGRAVNRDGGLDPLLVTSVSMGAGALALLTAGGITESPPVLSAQGWLIVLWLAVVNTAFAFTLWNATLRRLSAVESSIINNTMLVQIAILAWLFLDEPLGPKQIIAFTLVVIGVLAVQLRARNVPGGHDRSRRRGGAGATAVGSD